MSVLIGFGGVIAGAFLGFYLFDRWHARKAKRDV